jgi:hypothetical protein
VANALREASNPERFDKQMYNMMVNIGKNVLYHRHKVTETFLTLVFLGAHPCRVGYREKSITRKGGGGVPSHMVEPSFEELMAGRVQPSPDETPKDTEKRISVFQFMVEFLAPKVCSAKGWETDRCSIPLPQTNFTALDETMTKLVLENIWRQLHAAPGSIETKERGRYTWQGTNQNGMGCSQEGIDWYNELFKETVLNWKESWVIDFEMDVVEPLKE